jgi:site-specific DNA-methyltransferase (adenine-specific)
MIVIIMDDLILIHGDCLGSNGLSTIPDESINMVLCDLPYGTTNHTWDSKLDLDAVVKEYNRIIKTDGAIILFGSQPFTTDLINANRKYFRYELVWHKNSAANFLCAKKMPLKVHENVLVFYKNSPSYTPQKTQGKPYKKHKGGHVCEHYGRYVQDVGNLEGLYHPKSILNFPKRKGLHPTEKPIDLLEWLIKSYSKEGDVVLDNTFGCGSCAIACLNTKRRFIGWEMNERYYDTAIVRIDKHSKLILNERSEFGEQ